MPGMLEILESLDDEDDIPEDTFEPKLKTPEDKKLRELKSLPMDKKRATAFEMKMKGYTISAIATIFDNDEKTIYRWLSDHAKTYRQHLETELPFDIVAESLQFLTGLEEICLFEIGRMDADAKDIDPKTGEVKTVHDNKTRSQKVKLINAAMQARGMKIRLMEDTGLIPKEPERIYHTLKAHDPEEVKETTEVRTEEEIQKSIMKLIEKGRAI